MSAGVNGELAGKKAQLMPKVVLMKEQVDKIVEVAEAELGISGNISKICTEVKNLKQLAEDFLTAANKGKKEDDSHLCQYVAKIQGLRPQYFKDVRNILQNALGMGTVKFAPTVRNSSFVEINFTTEEIMNKGLKIIRNKPLGLTLCVVETRKVDKKRLPPESVLDPMAAEYDPIIMYKESLLRSRELTEQEYNIMLKWKQKFIRHVLSKMCDKMDQDVTTVVKDRTEGFFFKLEDIKSTVMETTDCERYQTYSGVNPVTDKLEMGYWGLGSDVPSRLPRSACVREVLKVLTDFIASSDRPLYDLRVRKGYWDSIMIRANHKGECMVVLVVHLETKTDTAKDCESMKQLLVDLLETGDGKDCRVKSLHLKTLIEKQGIDGEGGNKGEGGRNKGEGGRKGKYGAWFHVYGDEHIDEEVAGLKVRLYKNTFFWGDGSCTEQLCETIVDELSLTEKSGVLEMGVATGLICMYLATRCTMVVGLDRMQSVLPLAKANVELNNLNNVQLIQGGPTTSISSLKTHFKDCEDVFAVITETSSNARSKDEVLGMRKSPWIKKMAYLIISYKDVTSSLKLMCSKNADTSDPFVIVKVIPFDVTSTNVRPDILLILERASELEGRTEKRTPKTKASSGASGPPAKKAKLNNSGGGVRNDAGQRPRALLTVGNKKFGSSPQLSTNRAYMGKGGYPQNPGGFNLNQGGFSQNRAGYSQNQGGYSQNQSSFSQNLGGFSQNQGSFSQNQGSFSQNQGSFSQNQGGYSQNQGGYSMNQGGFSQNQGGYPQNQGGYSQNQGSYSMNQSRNQGFMQPNESGYQPWKDNSSRNQYDSGSMNSMSRAAAAMEEETLLLERVRRQKELQLQQIQEAVIEAQRRRLADSLVPAAPVQNIEEVVLSAIKKTGLLEKVSALSDIPVKPTADLDSPRRDTDRWSSSYNQRSSSAERQYQGRGDSAAFPNKDTVGFQDKDVTSFQDSFGYQNRDVFQDRDSTTFQSQNTSGYVNRDSTGYQNRDVAGDTSYSSGGGFYGNSNY